jgi:signal transduction histidine kinase
MQRLEDEARRSRVTMVLKPTCAVSVTASPTVVSVAVGNVLHNAVKFCGDGGRVAVNVDIDGADAVVQVSDTGPGVIAEEIPLIFERFHRGSGPRAAGAPGVGLGLAICRALIERQGGRISVASTPGRGASFAIRLPMAPAPREPEALKG